MARQHPDTAVISEGHKEVVSEQQVQRQNAQPPSLFVFLFGRIVHRTIRIRPNSLKPLFGTPLIIIMPPSDFSMLENLHTITQQITLFKLK